jgi:two-component system alkaline phosphatase synthesis response regulator PhoP
MSLGKILIVEDEDHLAEGIKLNLECEGYEAETEANGRDADERLQDEQFDLVLLDVMLPGLDGFEVCRRMRNRDDRTPVLFLTARKSPDDRITGLDIGGDDYLQKPFHLRELLSRVHAILRRRAWLTADRELDTISFGASTIDMKRMEGSGPRGAVRLSRRECLILKLLAEREGEPVSRNEILDRAWGKSQYPTDRTVDNFIVRLRQHFEEDPAKPKHILTVRSVGYRLDK